MNLRNHQKKPPFNFAQACAAGSVDTSRQQLIGALQRKIDSWGIGQQHAAMRLHVSRPYLNTILNDTRRASIEKLIELVEAAGLLVNVEIAEK